MSGTLEKLFLPGFGARGRFYQAGLSEEWTLLEPPSAIRNVGSFAAYRSWIADELDRRPEPIELAGHSMGGALAIAAAAARPLGVARLVLISPAGLPLAKPIRKSLAELPAHLLRGRVSPPELARGLGTALRSPRSFLRLAREVHDVDLSAEMRAVREAGIPTTVIACVSDTLVTVRHCRAAAKLLGAGYRELTLAGGHLWMAQAWPRFATELS